MTKTNQELKTLVAQDRLDEVFSELLKVANEYVINDVYLLQGRHNKLSRDIRLGLVDFQSQSITKAQITDGLFDLIDSLFKTTATPTPAPTPAPVAEEPPAVTPPDISEDEQELLNLVNKARADAGVKPLEFDKELMNVARLKAKDMVENNYFSHQSPTYGSPFDMMRQFGISFKTAGENIAGNQTVEGAFKLWMNSESHTKNILNSNFNYTGIGIVPSSTYGKVIVQQLIGR